MTARTITRSEFVNGAGEGVYVSTVHYASAAEREAGDAACQRVVVAAAFVPDDGLAGIVGKGREFDPEEPWPSDRTATEYAPQAVSTEYAVGAVAPPNCDGDARYGQEPTQAGQALAHAQHEAAIDGDECTATGCLITRGSD